MHLPLVWPSFSLLIPSTAHIELSKKYLCKFIYLFTVTCNAYSHGGQRTTLRNQFSFSTLLALELNSLCLRSWWQAPLSSESSHWPHVEVPWWLNVATQRKHQSTAWLTSIPSVGVGTSVCLSLSMKIKMTALYQMATRHIIYAVHLAIM